MKHLFFLTTFLFSVLHAQPSDSLVRINSTLQNYNASQPWEKNPPRSRQGLGVLLPQNQILTTAAMAADAIYLELESADSTHSLPAKVVAIDYEANLALLAPDAAPGFLTSLTPTEVSAPPKIGEKVTLMQLERNGNPLATQGSVLAADLFNTFTSNHFFLCYTVKGSLQGASNSNTLPAFYQDKLVGLLTTYNAADQISTLISAEIITAFLNDAQDGTYEGFPSMGVGITTTEDPHFRAFLQVPEDRGGIYLTRVLPNGAAAQAGLQKGDVILGVSGFPIDRRAYYQHPIYGTLSWIHLVRGGQPMGATVPVEFLRDGEIKTVEVTLQKAPDPLVPSETFDEAPPFLIKGGLVFQELTQAYLEAFGKEWATRAPLNLLDALSNPADYEEGRRRLVVLTRVVATQATIGYDRLNSQIVESANGKKITDLADLDQQLSQTPANGIHLITTDQEPFQIYLDENLATQVDKEFLTRGLPLLKRIPSKE